MTTTEIIDALEKRGWTQSDLAKKLCMSKDALNRVLTGKAALRPTLSAHIELLLNSTKEQLIMFKLTYPEALCQSWLPGWDELSPEQRQKGIEAVLMEAARLVAEEKEREMTEEEIAQLKEFCSTLRGPAREFDGDAEDLEAAEGE